MENTSKVSLKIGPMTLNLLTSDPPQYIEKLAEKLDVEIRAVINSGANITLAQACGMAALKALDEAKKATEAADNLRGLLKAYLEDINKYRNANEDAKKEIERLKALSSENPG